MKRKSGFPICAGLAVCLAIGPAAAQSRLSAPSTPAGQAGAAPNITVEVYMMLEQLQQEVRELRGMVEQQAYTIEQLKSAQRDHYMDLDRRILNLDQRVSQGTGKEPAPPVVASPEVQQPKPAATGTASEKAPPVASEAQEKAYQAAYDLVRQRRFEQAVDALHAFINQYPEGDLTANAYYWLGEVYLALPNKLEQAKQAFTLVASRYATHRKAPDALFKLGVTWDRIGDKEQARVYLNSLIAKHPNSSAAGLARDYLNKL